jgi:hypothetical protein
VIMLRYLERLHRSTITVTITIKSGSHKCMMQIFMDTVKNVSPTGAAITIKFMVMVTAAINSGSLWRDFSKTINTAISQNCCLRTWNRRFDDGNRCAARSADTCRRAICDSGNVSSQNRCRAHVGGDGGCRTGLWLFRDGGTIKDASHATYTATVTAAAVDSFSGAQK